MAYKVRSPFNSPFTKAMLAVFWAAYVFMLVALVVSDDRGFLFVFVGWTIGLPWITWNFLSGVKVEPGKSVGGGPMYTRMALSPTEIVAFEAPVAGEVAFGHLFVTNERLILLGVRMFGQASAVQLSDIDHAKAAQRGFGWPYPRESVRIVYGGKTRILRPMEAPSWMGGTPGMEFVNGLLTGLRQAGVKIQEEHRSRSEIG